MDINAILKGLGAAATNPLAFVAYLGAIAAWGILRWRVDRNKNLLSALNKLPENDRRQALRDEMGVVELKEGLSPEQFLRSRIHQYYFLGFIVLCAVVVILFAISAYKTANAAATTPDPTASQMKALDDIDLGVSKAFVIDKLGQPRHSASQCADYRLPFADVCFVFDKNSQVLSKYVVRTRGDYKPEVLGRFDLSFQDNGCLGCFSFREASKQYEGYTPPPVIWFNVPAGGPTIYAETYRPPGRSWKRTLTLVSSSEGVGHDPAETDAWAGLYDYLMKWRLDDFGKFYNALTDDQKRQFNEFRGKLKPNGYIEIADTDEPQKDDDSNEVGTATCSN